ncbi:Peroxidase 24 [Linum grandiflorum]
MGCDASILLDSTSTNKAEKDAIPNLSISGYNVIDEIKSAVEKACPGTVSCADILALAARDAVSFQFKKPMWAVPLGRKDSRVSKASDALTNLPSPDANFTQLLQQFNDRGLDLEDLVALSGAHTIGVSRCGAVIKRLYNFTGVGDTDPAMAPKYAEALKARCGNFQPNLTVELDPGSSYKFDAHYYRALIENQGLLPSDVTLMSDPRSAEISRNFAGDEQLFFDKFGRSMVKLGALGKGLDGGEIRKNCRLVN